MKRPAILLINPPVYDFSAYDLWSKPLGLLYIAAVLRDQSCNVHLIDAMNRWDESLVAVTKQRAYHDGHYYKEVTTKPDVFRSIPRNYYRYGIPGDTLRKRIELIHRNNSVDAVMITSIMTYWYQGVFEVIRMCKEIMPEVPVVLGGIYATLFHEHAVYNSGADIVMKGQSENQVVDWLSVYFGTTALKNYSHVDDLPMPAYDLYDKTGHAAVLTSRGCPYGCSFCATRVLNGSFVQRSPESVFREILHYAENTDLRDIAFYDDALFANAEKHIKPVLRSCISKNIFIRFHSPNGLFARYIDRELAQLIVLSGFKTIRLSFESNDQTMQDNMKKVSDVDLINAITYLEEAGFPRKDIKIYLLMGLSGQTPENVKESILFVRDLGVRISMSNYSPIPGTAEWKKDISVLPELEKEPLLTNKSFFPMKNSRFTYDDYEQLKSLVSTSNRFVLEKNK